jgi:hypothetical protein
MAIISGSELVASGTKHSPGKTSSKRLKDGWCNFEALGLKQAQKHFGNDWKLGKTWYIAERVTQDALKGFEEHTL